MSPRFRNFLTCTAITAFVLFGTVLVPTLERL